MAHSPHPFYSLSSSFNKPPLVPWLLRRNGKPGALQRLSTAVVGMGTVLLLVAPATISRAQTTNGTAVRDWNLTTTNAIAADNQDPPTTLRTLALVHAAMYDAIQAIDTSGSSARYVLNGKILSGVKPGMSRESAAAAAARIVLLQLTPDQSGPIDAAFATTLSQVQDDTAKAEGALVGSWVGLRMLEVAARDASAQRVDYSASPGMGVFQPAASAKAASTQYPGVTPLVAPPASQFRAPPPPDLGSAQYAADFNEVKRLGSANSTGRTADQTQIALFWLDTDGQNWNAVARQLSAQRHNTLEQDALLFAEMNVAAFNGIIAVFRNKYLYNYWRPVAAIQAGNMDGNSDTIGDPTWTPLRPTPSQPDYPSAHATNSGAYTTVLASFFGETTSFSFTSRTSPGAAVRSYSSFTQAANDEAASRIYVGFHFRTAVLAGLTLGRQVADWTLHHFGPVIPANSSP